MAGKKVFSYTLNHTQDILQALNLGIDGFFTDDPGLARRVLAQKGLINA
jgi:glycerophosphoryl diester phosphodiesterase